MAAHKTLTPETITHLRELDAARTQGEWESREGYIWRGEDMNVAVTRSDYREGGPAYRADGEFIAAAANAMSGLLDATEERDRLRTAWEVHDTDCAAAAAEVSRLRAELAEAERQRAIWFGENSRASIANRPDRGGAADRSRQDRGGERRGRRCPRERATGMADSRDSARRTRRGAGGDRAMSDLPTPCALPGYWQLCEQPPGAGRPRRYCTDDHRRQADTMRKRTIARLTMLRDQVRRDEHLLAALGGPDDLEGGEA